MEKISNKLLPLFLTSFIAGIILSILGPFATARMPFSDRLFYWVGLCIAGGFGVMVVDETLARWGRQLKIWQETLIESFGATALVFLFLMILTPPGSFYGVAISIFYIWIIAIVLCSIGQLIELSRAGRQTAAQTDSPALLDRLPPKLRDADIYALTSEDHYVRVLTSKGDDLILMRLSDAITETSPLPGLQTHRSWWVAQTGITKVTNADGKMTILLKNGTEVPVSRANRGSVREANWV